MDSVSKLFSNSMLEDLLSLNSKFLDVQLRSLGWENNVYLYTNMYAFNKIITCKNEARDYRMPAQNQKLTDTHKASDAVSVSFKESIKQNFS